MRWWENCGGVGKASCRKVGGASRSSEQDAARKILNACPEDRNALLDVLKYLPNVSKATEHSALQSEGWVGDSPRISTDPPKCQKPQLIEGCAGSR